MQVASKNVEQTLKNQRNQAAKGLSFSDSFETETYTKTHTIEDGIERIVYTPKKRLFDTPIIMQHSINA